MKISETLKKTLNCLLNIIITICMIYTALKVFGFIPTPPAPSQQPVATPIDTSADFRDGFEKGVRYGIVCYMDNTKEDDLTVHTKNAIEFYKKISEYQPVSTLKPKGADNDPLPPYDLYYDGKSIKLRHRPANKSAN